MIVCEFCGREEIRGVCAWCEKDRRGGEAFARLHGMPWEKALQELQAIWDAQVDRHTVDGHVDVEAFNKEARMSPEAEQGLRDIEPILQFFGFAHLREDLAKISKPFHDMAHDIVGNLPRNPERTTALRKLLESKDCAVRAFLYK